MDWFDLNTEMDRRRDVLERIVGLLLLLGILADRAAGLPARRRCRVLHILACGEAEARAFITGLAREPVDEPVPLQEVVSAGDAERLAVSLRVLALVLVAMMSRSRWSTPLGGRRAVLPIAHCEPAGRTRARLPFHALRAPDTS